MGDHRLDELAAARDGQHHGVGRGGGDARRFAVDSRRGRDPVGRLVGLQHRQRPQLHLGGAQAAFAWKRRRARPSISSTSSKVPAAAGSGRPTISARSSYVSQQLADDFQCEPDELLGRQFTDLLSVDTGSSDVTEERKTLGFHLSARFPFSDVVVRPASDQDVHWSLSGNPCFDDRGRFLGFRGIGTDLTEQRRSEREITRLARFNSLTGLAQPGDDATDARGSAAQRGPSAEGLRALHDRPRPVQERQRHARPPDRRRAASPGRRSAEIGDGQPRPGRPPRRRRIPGGLARDRRHRPA